MNYVQLYQAIQDYAESTEPLFITNIPRFVQEAEERIYNSVQLASLRKNVTGTLTSASPYLSAPNDYLATYSLAVIDASGNYEYLLNKDVNFIRQAYPNPTTDVGAPKYYGLFGPTISGGEITNELSFIIGPTPSAAYSVELHYYYYPATIVQGVITLVSLVTPGGSLTAGTYYNVPLTGGSGIIIAANGRLTVTATGSGSYGDANT